MVFSYPIIFPIRHKFFANTAVCRDVGGCRSERKGKGMTDPNKICFVCMGELQSEGCICPSCGHDNRLRGNGPGFLKSTVLGGQYFVGKVLGRGGFGITYLGLDLLLNRKVAIKEYFPEGVAYRDSETEKVVPFGGHMQEVFAQGVTRALREARNRHRRLSV